MVVISLPNNRELAIYKDFEIIAPRQQAIGQLLKILTESNYFK